MPDNKQPQSSLNKALGWIALCNEEGRRNTPLIFRIILDEIFSFLFMSVNRLLFNCLICLLAALLYTASRLFSAFTTLSLLQRLFKVKQIIAPRWRVMIPEYIRRPLARGRCSEPAKATRGRERCVFPAARTSPVLLACPYAHAGSYMRMHRACHVHGQVHQGHMCYAGTGAHYAGRCERTRGGHGQLPGPVAHTGHRRVGQTR